MSTELRRPVLHRLPDGAVPQLGPQVGRLFGAELLAVLAQRQAVAADPVPALRLVEGGGGGAARSAE